MKIFTNQDPSRTLGSNANNTWYTLNAIIINLELRQSITMLSLQLANSAGCCMKSLNLPQSQTNLRTVSQSHSSSLGQFRHRRYDWIIHRSVRQNIKRTCIMGPLLWMPVSFFDSLIVLSLSYLSISLVIVTNKGKAPASAWSPLHGEVNVSNIAILLKQREQVLKWKGCGEPSHFRVSRSYLLMSPKRQVSNAKRSHAFNIRWGPAERHFDESIAIWKP